METPERMPSIQYSIHGLVTVRIQGLSSWVLRDLNTKFHFFETQSLPAEADIEVLIGPFQPDLTGARTVDQRYHVRRSYLYFYEEDKDLRWEAEIRWKENGKIAIRYSSSASNRLKMPWTFFPEMVLHQYILIPLLEELLIQKGWYLLHAGAAAKNDKAVLWIGRGATYKTTFTLRSLNAGYEILGDDFVLVHGKRIYSFPTSPLMLEFTHRHLKDERLGIWEQFRLASYLASHEKASLPFTDSADIGKGILLRSYDGVPGAGDQSQSQSEKIEMIVTNQLLERSAYVSYRYRIGQFLEAYDYVYPGVRGIPFEKGFRDLVQKSFADAVLEIRDVRLDFQEPISENSSLMESQA